MDDLEKTIFCVIREVTPNKPLSHPIISMVDFKYPMANLECDGRFGMDKLLLYINLADFVLSLLAPHSPVPGVFLMIVMRRQLE